MGALAMHFTNMTMSETALKARRPPVYEAYQEFLLGFDLWNMDNEKAVRHFTRAVELDPSFFIAKFYIVSATSGNPDQNEKADALLQSLVQNRNEISPLENRLLDYHVAARESRNDEALRFIREAEKLAPNNMVINRLAGAQALGHQPSSGNG